MTGPIITLKPAANLQPAVERWSWKVSHWYQDDPDHVMAQGVEVGLDRAFAAARRAVFEPSSLIEPRSVPEGTDS